MTNLKQLWDNVSVTKIPDTVRDWLARIGKEGGKRGGKSTSKAKAEAARRNGAKGGRPRKSKTEKNRKPQ